MQQAGYVIVVIGKSGIGMHNTAALIPSFLTVPVIYVSANRICIKAELVCCLLRFGKAKSHRPSNNEYYNFLFFKILVTTRNYSKTGCVSELN